MAQVDLFPIRHDNIMLYIIYMYNLFHIIVIFLISIMLLLSIVWCPALQSKWADELIGSIVPTAQALLSDYEFITLEILLQIECHFIIDVVTNFWGVQLSWQVAVLHGLLAILV